MIKKECFAISWAVQKFCSFLYGKEFVVETMVADLCQSTICRLFVISWRKDDKTTKQ
jgi:hypothetical protein